VHGSNVTWGQALKKISVTTGIVVTVIGALVLVTPYRPKDWASRRNAWDPNAHEYHRPRSSSRR
jgi:hypothetical protein